MAVAEQTQVARLESHIPVQKSALLSAIQAEAGLTEEGSAWLEDVARLLAAVLHYEAFDELERLKLLYRLVDPDAVDAEPTPAAAEAFQAELEAALQVAGFQEKPTQDLIAAADANTLQDVRIRTSEAGIRKVRFFVRGARDETVTARSWWILKRAVTTTIYDDVVVIVALKGPSDLAPKEANAFSRLRRGAKPGAVLVRRFGAVPQIDMVSLHPGATAAMKRRDQLILGVPAVAGGVPLLLQMGNALTVLFAVLAAYLGMAGAVGEDRLKQALAAISGLAALGAFLMRQRLKFNAQRLDYQKKLADTVYFHTIANNAGVLDGLISEGEHQDLKEAVLAYGVLLGKGAMDKAALDKACEVLLHERLSLTRDFEIGDALSKLERMRLIERAGETLSAVTPDEALARLDEAWDAYFSFRRRTA